MSALPDGYRVARAVFSEADLDPLRAAIAETIDRVAGALRAPRSASLPDAPIEDRLDRIAAEDLAYAFALLQAVMADTQRDERLRALAEHPRLDAVLREVVAPDLPMGHIVRPRAVVPAFSSLRSHWHQDVTRKSADYRSCGAVRVAAWIPLADVDAESGALEVVPGSWSAPLPHTGGVDGRFHIADEDVPALPREVVPLDRGDVLLLDPFIPHRALPVHHGRARWAIVMWVKAAPAGTPC